MDWWQPEAERRLTRYLSAGPSGTCPPAPTAARNLWCSPWPPCFSCLGCGVCVCGAAGGMSGYFPTSVSRERPGGGSSREDTRRKKEIKPPYPIFACPGALPAQHGASAARPPRRSAEPPAAAEPAPPGARNPRAAPAPPASSLQHGSGDCGWGAVLPLLDPLPRGRGRPPQNLDRGVAQCPRVSVRIPGCFAPGCGSPLGRVDRLPLGESPSEQLQKYKYLNVYV